MFIGWINRAENIYMFLRGHMKYLFLRGIATCCESLQINHWNILLSNVKHTSFHRQNNGQKK